MKPLSLSALAVLSAVSRSVRYGFDIMDATNLPSGTVYPVLGRLERDGYVRSKWESQATAQREKRPPRGLAARMGRRALVPRIAPR